ncbi:hypothetical protein EAG18_08410 [Pseudoalteromonas sp. J010]|uniref:hypothetical protein n=1 Tax=Pseudoalteromonas sp. J010 TaxID=998465 RepID=UPI000F6522FD|nr:hypothetical protein [Pseudoalteromonas sp. J010]RRS09133.1 hypothetical protein EAG18_08410 [Pseudoalteromonas sp. J010]
MSKLRANSQIMPATISRELVDPGFEANLVKFADDIASLSTVKASISYVDSKVSDLINSAPEALDTLKELADALGNDADFAATVTTALTTQDNRIKAIEDDTSRIMAQDIVSAEDLSAQVDGAVVSFDIAKSPRVGSAQVFVNGLAVFEDSITIDEATKKATFVTAPQIGDKVRISYIAER